MQITIKDIRAVVDRINLITNSPGSPWSKDGDKYRANVGNYHLDSAYGGHQLVRMVNDGGGIEVIIHGYRTKRDLYNLMQAFIAGYVARQS